MPGRLFNDAVRPQRIRTFLVLFALALTLPLVTLAVFAFQQMASLEEQEIERRVLQVAQDLAGDIDRELESATVTLETLATFPALARRDFAAFHEQASRALKREKAGILLVDHTFQQLLNTRAAFGTPLPKTTVPETAQKVFDTKQRQVSDLFVGLVFDGEQVRYVLIMALDATRFHRTAIEARSEQNCPGVIANVKQGPHTLAQPASLGRSRTCRWVLPLDGSQSGQSVLVAALTAQRCALHRIGPLGPPPDKVIGQLAPFPSP
jgi:hypothetical protein